VEGDLVSLRSDIDEDLNASEKQANHRMNSFEKQLTLSNRRLEKEVKKPKRMQSINLLRMFAFDYF
jgi:hypothetical protein